MSSTIALVTKCFDNALCGHGPGIRERTVDKQETDIPPDDFWIARHTGGTSVCPPRRPLPRVAIRSVARKPGMAAATNTRRRCDILGVFGSRPPLLAHRLNPFLRFLDRTADIQREKCRQRTNCKHKSPGVNSEKICLVDHPPDRRSEQRAAAKARLQKTTALRAGAIRPSLSN